jgi:hypothetical protein
MSAPPQLPTPLALPRITVQPTLPLVIQEIKDGLHGAEDTWVSCYLEASPSVHGRLRVSEVEGGGDVELEGREGVQVVRVSNVGPLSSFSRAVGGTDEVWVCVRRRYW